jgi:hypothetical protein
VLDGFCSAGRIIGEGAEEKRVGYRVGAIVGWVNGIEYGDGDGVQPRAWVL